ncbi:hypothetical protein AGMMS50267_09520 [Spirochaetia bacterium]|nr:hypothetical protein AGMMS50267_09520 [Spirochaetia bacterium]
MHEVQQTAGNVMNQKTTYSHRLTYVLVHVVTRVIGAAMVFFAACAAAPKEAALPDNVEPYTVLPEDRWSGPYQIIEHKPEVSEEDLPEWVSRYLDEGIPGIEALPQYEDHYIFVGRNSGTNRDALNQWVEAFTPVQDSPLLIAKRVQARFVGASTGKADREYGRYFETLVRAAMDTVYTGVRKEADYWILKRFSSDDGEEDSYDFFILLSVEKKELQSQLNAILEKVSNDFQTAPKDQAAVINRFRATFYEGF